MVSLLLAACSDATNLVVGNPCSHPVLVGHSEFDAADVAERDSKAFLFRSLSWRVVPSGQAAVVAPIADAAGRDTPQAIWVDSASYRRTVTFAEVEEMTDPLWMDSAACTSGSEAPSILVLLERVRTEDAIALEIQVAAPTEVRDSFVHHLRTIDAVEIEFDAGTPEGVVTAVVFANPRGHYAVLGGLAGFEGPGVIYACDNSGCTTDMFDDGLGLPLVFL